MGGWAGILVEGKAPLLSSKVHGLGVTPLFEVAGTSGAIGLFLGLGQGGEQEGRQDRDDGDHDQKLDERKGPMVFSVHKSCTVISGFQGCIRRTKNCEPANSNPALLQSGVGHVKIV